MLNIILISKRLIFIIFMIFPYIAFTQQDSTQFSKPLTSIDDSTVTSDSTKLKVIRKPFFVKYEKNIFSKPIRTFSMPKKEIDRIDYRYSGDILSFLPFSFLNNLGYTGQPNEPLLFSNGFGNNSIIKDGLLLNNRWNNSTDLNIAQTESISNISIIPIHRSFLYGIYNNSTALQISSNDTLKSKPISRIRYFQAPNEEGFMDAFFSAKILPRVALSIRLTNSSIDENYKNTEYGAWKVNTGITYKITDSLFTQIKYDHVKLNTLLYGGIDIDKLLTSTSELTNNLYSSDASVLYEDMRKETTMHQAGARLFGNILSQGKTHISLSYNFTKDRFSDKLNDSTNFSNNNLSRTASLQVDQNIQIGKLHSNISAGFENIEYEIDALDLKETHSNYFVSGIASHRFLDGTIQPTIFGKYSKLNDQNNNGVGIDVKLNLWSQLKLLLGTSTFDKPLSLIEEPYYTADVEQKYNNSFASIEYLSNNSASSLSFFISNGKNVPFAALNDLNDSDERPEIVFSSTTDPKLKGLNFNTSIEKWNILLQANFNYYWNSENPESVSETKYNLTSGLYYVDTLFNSNLDLKAGFTFFLFDNPTYKVYDFQKMRGSSFYLNNSVITPISFTDLPNDKYRLDLLVSGRIQDAATFFIVYENILGNNNYLVPYYPMPEGGIKIGLSWDFLD